MANEMVEFTLNDLHVVKDEPRVRDLDLAARLGISNVYSVRKVIRANADELENFGFLTADEKPSGRRGGRPASEYLLNEAQAILVTMRSNAPNAPAARRALIEVFMAWRRGQLTATPEQSPPLPPPNGDADDILLGPHALAAIEALFRDRDPFSPPSLDELIRRHLHSLCEWEQKQFAKVLRAIFGSREPVLDAIRETRSLPAPPVDELDVDHVYRIADVSGRIPKRGQLSARIGNSLDAYCRKHRITLGSLDVRGQIVRVWPRQAILSWLAEDGATLIARHIAKHAPADQTVIPFPQGGVPA